MFGLEQSFDIVPAESSGPGPESESSKVPQNIFPFPLFVRMDISRHQQVIHKEKLLSAHQLLRKIGSGFELKSLKLKSVNLS